jgi:hypothetical protein
VSGDPHIECACDTVGGKAIWSRLLYDKVCSSLASGEPGVCPLLEEVLGRGVNPSGTTVLVTPRPIPGPAVLTPSSSLGSYIVPTDQHESFVRTLSSLMRTRENFPVGHPSQIAPSQARLTWRFFRDRLPKKKMHLVDMITLLILLSLGPGHPIPGARISQFLPEVGLGRDEIASFG